MQGKIWILFALLGASGILQQIEILTDNILFPCNAKKSLLNIIIDSSKI